MGSAGARKFFHLVISQKLAPRCWTWAACRLPAAAAAADGGILRKNIVFILRGHLGENFKIGQVDPPRAFHGRGHSFFQTPAIIV